MPNFPIPMALREHISSRALYHARKAHALALADFPLAVQHVQDVVMDPGMVAELNSLSARGFTAINKFKELRLALLREDFPELRRSLVLLLTLATPVFVKRSTIWGINSTQFQPDENHYIVMDANRLDAEARAALVAWVARALREHRLFEITRKTVAHLMDSDRTPTAGHLHAWWPLLASLVEPEVYQYHGDRAKFENWRVKLRNPPERMKRYRPSVFALRKLTPLIKAADVQISTGRMLTETDHSKTAIGAVAKIEHWERIEGDVVFPDALTVDEGAAP